MARMGPLARLLLLLLVVCGPAWAAHVAHAHESDAATSGEASASYAVPSPDDVGCGGGDAGATADGDAGGAATAATAAPEPTFEELGIVLSNADKETPEGLFRYANPSATGFYSLDNFPGLSILLPHLDAIREEAVAITEVLDIQRDQYEWGPDAAKFFDRLLQQQNRGWTVAWGANGKWLNYAIAYYEKIVPGLTETLAPRTVALLRQIPGIRIGGFSKLLPGAYLAPHSDTTGLKFHSLAFHFCLTGRANLLVGDNWVEQAPGKVIIFDATKTHAVKNHDEERIVLYMDIDLDVYFRETSGYDPGADSDEENERYVQRMRAGSAAQAASA